MHTLKRQSIMTTSTFCNQLSWIIWKAHNLVESAAWQWQKSFLGLLLLVRIMIVDRIYFDSGQNSIAERLRTNNFEFCTSH